MKKIFSMVLVMVMLLSGVVFAQDSLSLIDTLKKIPTVKQGIMYNFKDSELTYISTFEVAKYKNVSIEAGYDADEMILGVISYPVLKLKDLGVTIPVLDLIECNLGVGVGLDHINLAGGGKELKIGITATLINIKF